MGAFFFGRKAMRRRQPCAAPTDRLCKWSNLLQLRIVRNFMRLSNLADYAVVHEIRSEEHTSELQSLMRISYAVFCLKKKKTLPSPRRTTDNTQITTPTIFTHYAEYTD